MEKNAFLQERQLEDNLDFSIETVFMDNMLERRTGLNLF